MSLERVKCDSVCVNVSDLQRAVILHVWDIAANAALHQADKSERAV